MAYIGKRMSERAFNAYQEGAKPLSKWMKKEILDLVKEVRPDLVEKLSKVRKEELAKVCLIQTSWHHTGSFYNKTDFYEFDENSVEEITDSEIEKLLESKPAAKKVSELEDVYFEWIEWEGTKRFPKKVQKSGYGVKKGNWIYTLDIYNTLTKKKADGNWILKIESVNHVSREDRKKLNRIKKLMGE